MEQFKLQNIDPQKLIKFLENQNFRALKQRIIKEFDVKEDDLGEENSKNQEKNHEKDNFVNCNNQERKNFAQIHKIKINNLENLEKILGGFAKIQEIIIDIEFEKTNKNLAKNIIFSPIFDNLQQEIYQINIKNDFLSQNNEVSDLFSNANNEQKINPNEIPLKNILNCLKPIITDNSILKIGYKIKEIYKFFAKNNIEIAPSEDISVMSYIIDSTSNKSDLRNLIDLNLDENIEENEFGQAFEDLEKEKEPKLFEDETKKEEFYFFKNYVIWPLYNLLKNEIFTQKLNFVYQRFERPLMPILAKMEMEGILIDKVKLKSLSAEFDLTIKKLATEIYNLAGEEFNIASPQQLSHILFEKLNLPAGKKSKTGAFSTNSDILEDLDLAGHEIAEKILKWRHISKLKSTYSDSLPNNIDSETGRIHSNFSNIIAQKS